MKKKILLILFIIFMVFMPSCSEKKKEEIKKPEIEKTRVEAVKDSLPQKIEKPKIQKQKNKKLPKEEKKGGVLFARASDNNRIILPLKRTDVEMKITAGISQTNVTQTFYNDTKNPLEAIYIFPLPSKATITGMELRIGNKIIASVVKEKKEAKRTYEKAKKQGKRTALLEQERENIFTTSVANFQPGETVQVRFSYLEKLEYQKGKYELNFPMVIGQRYIPYKLERDKNSNVFVTSDVKDAHRINPPLIPLNMENEHYLSLNIEIDGLPIKDGFSSTHAIDIEKKNPQKFLITLAEGKTVPDCDFNLKLYLEENNSPQISLLNSKSENSKYSMITVFPPTKKEKTVFIPRDVIFLIDTSGSMSGSSIGQAKQGLKQCMKMLRNEDQFTIVRFANEFSYFSPALRKATLDKIESAKGYIDNLRARGGTEMQKALRYVLDLPTRDYALKMVIFLTDGCVGNEDTLFRLLNDKLGNGRLFTFGIGSAPNEHLMKKMAEIGRGQSRFIHSHEDIGEVMSDFFRTLDNPVLTDIDIRWLNSKTGKEEIIVHFPKKCPDVFYDRPLQLFANYPSNFQGKMKLSGILNGEEVIYDFPIDYKKSKTFPAIEKMFGRANIDDLMYQMIKTRDPETIKKLKDQVLQIALDHQLVSQYTSRVAVEYELKQEKQSDGKLKTVKVPVHLPKGWDPSVFYGTATNNYLMLLIGFVMIVLVIVIRIFSR